jgi:hypothetical protein
MQKHARSKCAFGFWILDFGLRIGRLAIFKSEIQNPQSAIVCALTSCGLLHISLIFEFSNSFLDVRNNHFSPAKRANAAKIKKRFSCFHIFRGYAVELQVKKSIAETRTK